MLLSMIMDAQALFSQEAGKNILGCEVGYLVRPFGFKDPYSWSVGGGVFYERHVLFPHFPLYAGGSLSYYGFYPIEQDYKSSFMVKAGLYLGYDFVIKINNSFTLALAPFAGYSHYWREFVFKDEMFRANRSVIITGVNVNLFIDSHLLIGLSAGIDLLLENNPLFTFSQTERLGWRF